VPQGTPVLLAFETCSTLHGQSLPNDTEEGYYILVIVDTTAAPALYIVFLLQKWRTKVADFLLVSRVRTRRNNS